MFSAATHRLITLPLAKYLDARLFGMCTRRVMVSMRSPVSSCELPTRA